LYGRVAQILTDFHVPDAPMLGAGGIAWDQPAMRLVIVLAVILVLAFTAIHNMRMRAGLTPLSTVARCIQPYCSPERRALHCAPPPARSIRSSRLIRRSLDCL
jgi:hypothetical protein